MSLVMPQPVQCVQIPGTNPPQYGLAADGGNAWQLLRSGRLDWDQSLLTVPEIAAVLKPGAVVVDAGAFIGDTTQLFLNQGCTVFAIEPQDDAFTVLENNCPAAICLHRALGKRGQKSVNTDLVSNTNANNLAAREVKDDPEGRPVLAIDDLHLAWCAFLKIDVEGFEPHVLEGAQNTLGRCRPVMHVEINPPALRSHGFTDWQEIYRWIERQGYAVRECFWHERVGTDLPWDILCLPK